MLTDPKSKPDYFKNNIDFEKDNFISLNKISICGVLYQFKIDLDNCSKIIDD